MPLVIFALAVAFAAGKCFTSISFIYVFELPACLFVCKCLFITSVSTVYSS